VKAKPTIAVGLGLVVVAGAAAAFFPRNTSPKSAALTARQNATEKLGQQIARLRPKCKVLVLCNPFTRKSGFLEEKAQFERAGLHGLQKGLGPGSTVTAAFPEVRPEYYANPQSVSIPPDCRTPLSFLLRPGCVDELVAAHPECSVIVSLIGLPLGIDQAKSWTENDQQSFALLLPDLRLLGPPEKAVEAFERGKILAAVADDALQPGTPLVITRDNVQDVLKRQPTALGY
jgi:hypothetical protein